MKKIIGISLVAMAFAFPPVAGRAATGDGCVAAAGSSCRVVAGPESDSIRLDDGTAVVSGRGSWIAGGEWTITIYSNADCAGAPLRVISSANNIAPDIAGANNGGVYFGLCAEATTGSSGVVLLGAIASDLLP